MNELIENKYYKWYLSFCLKMRDQRGYFTKSNKPKNFILHHIIPKSFYQKYNKKTGWLKGNPNEKTNLVFLTDREHFIVHKLLTKCSTGLALIKCVYAYKKMASKDGNFSKFYSNARKLFSENVIGSNHPKYGKKENPLVTEKRRLKLKGVPKTQEFRDNLRGKKQTFETIEKRLLKLIGRKRTDKQRENIANGIAKTVILMSPTNELVTIKNITKFSRENNLSFGNMHSVIRGDRPYHKGWRLP